MLKQLTAPIFIMRLRAKTGLGLIDMTPYPFSPGEWICSQIPNAQQVNFKEGGHLLFWVEAEKFNKALADFAEKL